MTDPRRTPVTSWTRAVRALETAHKTRARRERESDASSVSRPTERSRSRAAARCRRRHHYPLLRSNYMLLRRRQQNLRLAVSSAQEGCDVHAFRSMPQFPRRRRRNLDGPDRGGHAIPHRRARGRHGCGPRGPRAGAPRRVARIGGPRPRGDELPTRRARRKRRGRRRRLTRRRRRTRRCQPREVLQTDRVLSCPLDAALSSEHGITYRLQSLLALRVGPSQPRQKGTHSLRRTRPVSLDTTE